MKSIAASAVGIKALLDRALDVVFPPVCVSCGAETHRHGLICATCFTEVRAILPPFCHSCAMPVTSSDWLNSMSTCPNCAVQPPIWSNARAGFVFNDMSRSLIFGLKYGDRAELSHFFARAMLRYGSDIFEQADIVAPVPLHWRRLRARKFNQSALIAHALNKITGQKKPVIADLLRRSAFTSPLAHLSPEARFKAVSSALHFNEKYEAMIKGRRVVLVDDILTTGATLAMCTRKLRDCGAAQVNVMVAARSGKHQLPYASGRGGLVNVEG